jgi:hypothetical protein
MMLLRDIMLVDEPTPMLIKSLALDCDDCDDVSSSLAHALEFCGDRANTRCAVETRKKKR